MNAGFVTLAVVLATLPSCSVAQCTTVSGPDRGAACVFPFTFDGVRYTECTTEAAGADGKAWCSTRTDATGQHVGGGGHYGHCPRGGCGDNRVFQLNEDDEIECQRDRDCPRAVEKISSTEDPFTNGDTITELNVKHLTCSTGSKVCTYTEKAFCNHPLGQRDPECLRCKTGRPNPPCYRRGSEQSRQCCYDLASGEHDKSLTSEGFFDLYPTFSLAQCLACSHYSTSYSYNNASIQCEKWLSWCTFENVQHQIDGYTTNFTSSIGGLSAIRLQNLSTKKQRSCGTGQCRTRDARRPGNFKCCRVRGGGYGAKFPVCPYRC